MTHDELRELVPVFALDALTGSEEREVRAHLQACPACRESLNDFQQVTGSLALGVEPVALPEGLRQRVLQDVARTPQVPAATPVAARTPQVPAATPVAARRRFGWRQVTALVAVAAVLALGGLSISLAHQLQVSHRQLAQQRAFIGALGTPVLTTVPLVATGSEAKASGQLYVAAGAHSAGLVLTGLPDPGTRVYQVWLIVDNAPSPVTAFRPDPSGQALVPVSADLTRMQGMAVTLEDRPGLPAPRGPKVLQSA